MSVKVGQLFRKSTTKTTSGRIINMLDEANGGYIVRNGIVVNQERWAELQKIEEDKRKAAQAVNHQAAVPPALDADRATQPTRVDALEKKVGEIDGKLDAILKAISQNK